MDYEVKAGGIEASFDALPAPAGDPLAELRAEVARLSGIVTNGQRRDRRPAIATGIKADRTERSERDKALGAYLRHGTLPDIESKAFAETTNSGADGGYGVPLQIDSTIQETLRDISPIRRIANVVQVGTSNYRRLVTLSNVQSGWVNETSSRNASTNSLQFGTVAPPMGELYANPAASQNMIDDAVFDLEGWLATEISREFARAEGAAFVKGTGVSQPLGFLTSPASTAADGSRAFGTLQYIVTGVSGAFPTASPQDMILNLVYALRPSYRQNATFVMNTTTIQAIRKFKDNYGMYIWQPATTAGQPDTLFGYPVIDAEDMPAIGAGSFSIAFGDFNAGYLIAERQDTRVLRDPFTNKPYVNFYATKRVSGCVANSEAIKLLKFDVS